MKIIEDAQFNVDAGYYNWELRYSDDEDDYIEAWHDANDEDMFKGTKLFLIQDWDLKDIVNYIKKAHECGLKGEELHIERHYRKLEKKC